MKIRRALISVSNKTGLVGFVRRLVKHDVEILSTGGTASELRNHDIEIRDVSNYTKFPEIITIVINEAAIRIVDCWSRRFRMFLSVKKPSVVKANNMNSVIVITAIPYFLDNSNTCISNYN